MVPAHMDLLRPSQSARLEFVSVLCEAFLNTPLHSKLLNLKFSRSWSLAQELWAGRKVIAMTKAPLRKPSLLTKTAREDLLPWEQALLCCPLEASLLLASSWVCSTPSSTRADSQLALGCTAHPGKH